MRFGWVRAVQLLGNEKGGEEDDKSFEDEDERETEWRG